jgi:hypothetical protein
VTDEKRTHGNCGWWERWPKTMWGEVTLYGSCINPELPLAIPGGGYKCQLFEMDSATDCPCWKALE